MQPLKWGLELQKCIFSPWRHFCQRTFVSSSKRDCMSGSNLLVHQNLFLLRMITTTRFLECMYANFLCMQVSKGEWGGGIPPTNKVVGEHTFLFENLPSCKTFGWAAPVEACLYGCGGRSICADFFAFRQIPFCCPLAHTGKIAPLTPTPSVWNFFSKNYTPESKEPLVHFCVIKLKGARPDLHLFPGGNNAIHYKMDTLCNVLKTVTLKQKIFSK